MRSLRSDSIQRVSKGKMHNEKMEIISVGRFLRRNANNSPLLHLDCSLTSSGQASFVGLEDGDKCKMIEIEAQTRLKFLTEPGHDNKR